MSLLNLLKNNNKIIINTDLDGVLSGLLLKQYANCEIVGFSNSANKVWINPKKINSIYDAVYIDLYVPESSVTCIDQHIIGADDLHNGLISKNKNKLNPNLQLSRSHTPPSVYKNKYPLGTVHFIISLLEKDGVNIDLDLAKGVSGQINLADLILRADDAMHTTVATTFKENADTWWTWLYHLSGKGKLTNDLIAYLKTTSPQKAADLKSQTTTFLKGAPYYCESGDGGYKSIITKEGNLKKTLKFYVDMLAKALDVKTFYFGQEYKTFEGKLHRISLTENEKLELIQHNSINGQKIFSYAFIWGINKEVYFSSTVM